MGETFVILGHVPAPRGSDYRHGERRTVNTISHIPRPGFRQIYLIFLIRSWHLRWVASNLIILGTQELS